MEIKDISRERLEEIAQTLINRVEMFEGDSNFFVNALAYDGIELEEAEAFGFSFDEEEVLIHKVIRGLNGKGTYRFRFNNEDEINGIDATEFFAEEVEDMVDFWHEFCFYNDFELDCLIDVKFVCANRI